jgi:hypothetical protein
LFDCMALLAEGGLESEGSSLARAALRGSTLAIVGSEACYNTCRRSNSEQI